MIRYLEPSFSWNIVSKISEQAEKYEYNIYRQLIELEHSNDPTKHTEFFTKGGSFRERLGKERNWKHELVSMLKGASPYVNKAASWSDSEMIYFLNNILIPYTDFWLNNTSQGTELITSLGTEALVKELQTGRWYNKNEHGVLVPGKIIQNKSGLRREANILSGFALWFNKQDNDSVAIDTVELGEARHQEGRFDILVKLSKEKTHNNRKPMRFEAKSNVNSFVLGTLSLKEHDLTDFYNHGNIRTIPTGRYTEEGAPTYEIELVFSKDVVQAYVNKFLAEKYTNAEGLHNNIFPIFTNGRDYLLFSDFLVGAQNNLNVGIPDGVYSPSLWRDDNPFSGYNALLEPGVELAVNQITNKVFRQKLAKLPPRLTYGKPKI